MKSLFDLTSQGSSGGAPQPQPDPPPVPGFDVAKFKQDTLNYYQYLGWNPYDPALNNYLKQFLQVDLSAQKWTKRSRCGDCRWADLPAKPGYFAGIHRVPKASADIFVDPSGQKPVTGNPGLGVEVKEEGNYLYVFVAWKQ
ncbi:hypothetical protein B842_12310 [Corynebacterium humireducens NBRC 106098 = DSM 45392]|uniref:Uncharacterized protein n=2 Tax=Corynebacterium humireducens TaxID=1223514 RepID=A0A0B5DBI4_9CORY|nr:hypothetical protein [Corynebacterium humireducens]AJE34307.1 hypothetical protein B842_12310 [Corynebacterium humireducens NBRC 106098 = DSM 45392]